MKQLLHSASQSLESSTPSRFGHALHRATGWIRTDLAAFAVATFGVVSDAQAQVTYDRSIDTGSIQLVQVGGGAYRVDGAVRLVNNSGGPLDLSCNVAISINGVSVGSEVVHVPTAQPNPQGCYYAWDGTCLGSCGSSLAFCHDFAADPVPSYSIGCSCMYVMGFSSAHTYVLAPGDLVRCDLLPLPGSATEVFTGNDSAEIAVETPVATSYCTAGTTTSGCVPSMSASGMVSISAGTLVLTASGLEGAKTGLIFFGTSGRSATSWGSGSPSYLCVKSPTQRMSTSSTGGAPNACDGSISADFFGFMATHPAAIGQPLMAGTVFDAQCWFRDPPAVKTTNLTDAIEFTLMP